MGPVPLAPRCPWPWEARANLRAEGEGASDPPCPPCGCPVLAGRTAVPPSRGLLPLSSLAWGEGTTSMPGVPHGPVHACVQGGPFQTLPRRSPAAVSAPGWSAFPARPEFMAGFPAGQGRTRASGTQDTSRGSLQWPRTEETRLMLRLHGKRGRDLPRGRLPRGVGAG